MASGAGDRTRVMLDTSAWIEAFRGRNPRVTRHVRELLENDRVVTCGPVMFEIRRGLRQGERGKVIPLMEALPSIPFDDEDWHAAGDLSCALVRKGITLPSIDILVATLCVKHAIPVMTLDDHYRRIPGIEVIEFEG